MSHLSHPHSRLHVRHFLLARELPCLFALATSAAVLAATAPTDTLNPMSRPLHPLAVAFFALAALWVAFLWLYLLLVLNQPHSRSSSLPRHEVRPQEEKHHQHHHQQDHQALQTARPLP